jgi:hypothetical protein
MNLLRFLVLIPALTTISFAEDPAANKSAPAPLKLDPRAAAHVVVDVAVFAVPDERAFALLAGLRDPAKIEETARQLEAMAAKKEVQLLAWPQATAVSGQRAHSATSNEFRYPTEFDPPAAPNFAANEAIDVVSEPDAKPKLSGPRATPTAFETRDLGTHLEIAPILSKDAQRVVVEVKFSWAQFRGWTTYVGMIWQPQFTSLKSESSLVLRSGGRCLLGIHKLESPGNHVAIMIARASVERAGR